MTLHLLARLAEHAGPPCREAGEAVLHFLLSSLGGWAAQGMLALWGGQ